MVFFKINTCIAVGIPKLLNTQKWKIISTCTFKKISDKVGWMVLKNLEKPPLFS